MIVDGKTASSELADKWFTVEAHPPRVLVLGAADEVEARIAELEYAGLGQAEPVFAAAPPLPIAVGEQVGSMELLVRGLLYRCARGTIGYTSSTPIVVRTTLRSVDVRAGGQAGTFAVQIEPDVKPGISAHLRFEGMLVVGPRGWPLGLRGDGTLESSILHRRGETKIDARLALAVEWKMG